MSASHSVFPLSHASAPLLFNLQLPVNQPKSNPMIKTFTSFFAAALLSVAASAQTVLVEYNGEDALPSGIELLSADAGQIATSTVKIHVNEDAFNCISLGKSYSNKDAFSGNAVKLTTEGGFKAGDVVSITGVYNNSAEKQAAVAVFTLDEESKVGLVGTTSDFINARLDADDPVAETITLNTDADVIYLGRKGNTKACILSFSVTRTSTPNPPTSIQSPSADSASARPHKEVRDGRLVIVSGGKVYSLTGAIVK